MARIKVRDGEDLSDSNIERVIDALTGTTPCTKKAACDMLRISYNTKRLDSIIENYNEKKTYAKEMRKVMRSKAITKADVVDIIFSYLNGSALTDISDNTFRGQSVIKRVLNKYNVPLRDSSTGYFNPAYVEESSEDYKKDDLVFAARYGVPAYIVKKAGVQDSSTIYSIYLLGDKEKFAYQASYDLADLREVQNMGVNPKAMSSEEVKRLLYEAYMKSKKMEIKK